MWVKAQPGLGHPWLWLPGPGGATVSCLSQTDSVMGKGEHLVGSHHAHRAFTTNSVQKWKTAALNAARNMVGGIKSRLYGEPQARYK